MIVPDINLLIYAYNAGSRFHQPARDWWEDCLSGDAVIGLAWVTIMGFVRITTSPKAFAKPLPVRVATSLVVTWIEQPNVQIIHPGKRHAELFLGFLNSLGTGGNLTTDAHLAALAVEYQAELHTSDTDFARFSGLRWKNPLTSAPPPVS